MRLIIECPDPGKLRHVPVENRTNGLGNRHGEIPKHLVVPAGNSRAILDEPFCPEVVFIIFEDFFLRSPPVLELPEPLVLRFRPPEAKRPKSSSGAGNYPLPHQKIVRPQVLVSSVGSPVFVIGPVTENKVHVAGDARPAEVRQRDEAGVFLQNMLMEVPEKLHGLRGKTMLLTSHAIQPA